MLKLTTLLENETLEVSIVIYVNKFLQPCREGGGSRIKALFKKRLLMFVIGVQENARICKVLCFSYLSCFVLSTSTSRACRAFHHVTNKSIFCVSLPPTRYKAGTVAKSAVSYCTAAVPLGVVISGGYCTNQLNNNFEIKNSFFKTDFWPPKTSKLLLHVMLNAAKHKHFSKYYIFPRWFQRQAFPSCLKVFVWGLQRSFLFRSLWSILKIISSNGIRLYCKKRR